MPVDPRQLEVLWARLEDAKLQLDFALNYAKEIEADKLSGDIPAPDGYYAHRNALRGQEQAATRYLRALREFQAALASERGANGVSPKEPATGPAANGCTITPREREVLALIAAGKSSKQIAAELGIAFRTAVCHRYRLYQKLKVHTNVELTRAAMRMGLVDL